MTAAVWRVVWRVVCEGGEVREVAAVYNAEVGAWAATGEETLAGGALRRAINATARRAVMSFAMEQHWPVVELVAPGAQTSGERLAQVTAERDAYARMMAQDAEALGIDHAGDIPEAIRALLSERDDHSTAVRLLVAERDAAVAARDALAGAVREEREAKERAGIEHNALVDANDYAERRLYGWETRLRIVSERHRKAVNARIAAADRITALVDAALAAAGGAR